MNRLLLIIGVGACGFHGPSLGGPHDGALGDDGGGIADGNPISNDGSVDASTCATGFSALIDTCSAGFGGPISLTDPANCYQYDTDSHVLGYYVCSDNGTTGTVSAAPVQTVNGVDFLLVSSFTLGAGVSLAVQGTSPFAVVSTGAVVIDGTLLVSAGGRNAAQCGASGGANGVASGAGGGGGGGAGFREVGKSGGMGQANSGGGGSMVALPTLVGGCPGGSGGAGTQGGPAPGGSAGGAMYVASPMAIRVGGAINVGGDGGSGGRGDANNMGVGYRCGGGGGGSGGMIWLQAPMLPIQGVLAANGGGGGEGSGNAKPGADGLPGLASAARASGGAGNDPGGGDGGAGGTVTMPPVVGAGSSIGGGGGGGGGGFIKLTGTRTGGGVISPPAL